MTSTPQSPTDSSRPPAASSVAVIGAGISGVCAAAHALRQGLSVTVFERSNISGGVWHFDPRTAEEPSYPNESPSAGDYARSSPGELRYPTPPPGSGGTAPSPEGDDSDKTPNDAQAIRFAPPGPCYAGLMNNVPTSLMYSTLGPWPAGTEDFTSQINLERYIQQLAHDTKAEDVIQYNTRVDGVRKAADGSRWEVRTVQFQDSRLSEKTWAFDAVVVATGHYNMPRVPDVPGLKQWKAAFGSRVTHSKRYRTPDSFQGKNVFILGGGVSSTDICRELDGKAVNVYQSTRLGKYDLPATMLPENAERVTGVERFELDPDGQIDEQGHIPGRIILTDGRIIEDIDNVILATGYITSYPFLQELHSDEAAKEEAGDKLLVTKEGDMTHNLHRDIWYIEDPTLSFVGAPYHVSTFSLFDYQAQVVARVLAGKARVPTREVLRAEYEARIVDRGLGRDFHSLRAAGEEIAYVDRLVQWVNEDAKDFGFEPMEGHPESWREGYYANKERMKKRLGINL